MKRPFLLLAIAAALLAGPGCVSSAVRATAIELQSEIEAIHDCSRPIVVTPRDGETQAQAQARGEKVFYDAWEKARKAAAKVVEASR